MAAIASRYARALVDVILAQKIDGDIARQQLQVDRGSGARQRRSAPGVGIAGDIRRSRSARCWMPSQRKSAR